MSGGRDGIVGDGREVVIGLDVGTTAVKAVAFALGATAGGVAAGTIRSSASVTVATTSPTPGRHEQDPASLSAAVGDVLARCVAGLDGEAVAAVSVSTAMHGLVGLDARRRPLTPLLTWADGRAHEHARALFDGPDGVALHRSTGTPVHPMAPLAKLRWFADHEPSTAAAVHRWVGVKELVLDRLTGELVTEQSSASGTGLYDLGTRTWSPTAVTAAGTTVGRLPPVLPTTAALPLTVKAASRVGLRTGTPVVVGAADGPLANLGVAAIGPGVAGLSVGTSAALRTVVERPGVDDAGGLFCYVLTGDRWAAAEDRWVAGGALSNGGSVAGWAVGATGAADERALLALASTAPPGSDGLVMVPYLVPERAPLWHDGHPAAYVGLRPDHTRAHLARAAVEGVALQVALLVERLDARHPVREIRATGGVFEEPLWREVVAGAVDRPVTVTSGASGTALGAARLALIALGRVTGLADAVGALPEPGGSPGASGPVAVRPEDRSTYRDRRATLAAHLARR